MSRSARYTRATRRASAPPRAGGRSPAGRTGRVGSGGRAAAAARRSRPGRAAGSRGAERCRGRSSPSRRAAGSAPRSVVLAYIWPIETFPLLRARMRRKREKSAAERKVLEFMRTNAGYKQYVLKELERSGPLLSRELADHSVRTWKSHGWHGNRNVALLLEILHTRGVVAIVGRRNGQRLWDLAERWYPPDVAKVSLREADRLLEDARFRALGVRLTPRGWEAHPEAKADAVADRVTLLS